MIVVFTAILGTCDSLKPAPVGADRCVCFTDDVSHGTNPKGWEIQYWPSELWIERDPRREAWRLRAVPHELFEKYDTVVWIDASFTLTDLPRLLKDAGDRDVSGLRHHARSTCYQEGAEIVRVGQAPLAFVRSQLEAYQRVGFKPEHLTISCILVRSHSRKADLFNVAWDRQIRSWAGDNTQISLDYSAWKSGITIHALQGGRKANPYAQHDHADHKKRRQPYRTQEAVS